jgi:hypothetical protein
LVRQAKERLSFLLRGFSGEKSETEASEGVVTNPLMSNAQSLHSGEYETSCVRVAAKGISQNRLIVSPACGERPLGDAP